ncbi:MAG: hypoxanthine phosphoribosyltransferase [Candidatus Hinthialibacter antarcticus]|nr:hypoxanthine phosphoribosyltransferase [Candidatus Hinthialibacter antarcticus]
MIPKIESIVISEDQIQQKVRELAQQIQEDFVGDPLIVISVLKGGFIFHADLIRALSLDIETGFLSLSSYQGETQPQSKIVETSLPLPNLTGKNVLLLEDIYDTGASMAYAYQRCLREQPKTLKTCVFLIKEGVERKAEAPIDYSGFTIPNLFVVGYGLDYQERYRQLPYIAVPCLNENQ